MPNLRLVKKTGLPPPLALASTKPNLGAPTSPQGEKKGGKKK